MMDTFLANWDLYYFGGDFIYTPQLRNLFLKLMTVDELKR